jgi:hypothetical protein
MSGAYASRFKGVGRSGSKCKPWQAQIWIDGKTTISECSSRRRKLLMPTSQRPRGERKHSPIVGPPPQLCARCQTELLWIAEPRPGGGIEQIPICEQHGPPDLEEGSRSDQVPAPWAGACLDPRRPPRRLPADVPLLRTGRGA